MKSDINRLLEKIGRGETAALETLYREMKNGVYCYALSILSDKSAAEDVLQDTFVRVFTMAHTHIPGRDGRAWVLAIARNLCLDRLRSAGRKNEPLNESGGDPQSIPEALDFIGSLELKDALARLDGTSRNVILLHLAAGFKFREIAALMDEKQNRIQRLYYSAVKELSVYYAG